MNTFLPHREHYASPLQRSTLCQSTWGNIEEGLHIQELS